MDEGWCCEACTFFNMNEWLTRCEMCESLRPIHETEDLELEPRSQWKSAAACFSHESIYEWDNQGPRFGASEDRRSVWILPWDDEYDDDRETNWRQVRGDQELIRSEEGTDNLYKFSIRLDSLNHEELMIGTVRESAPKRPRCLHSSKPNAGVFLMHFSSHEHESLKTGQTLTMLIDLNRKIMSFSVNGKVLKGKSMKIPNAKIYPTVELYSHEEPK